MLVQDIKDENWALSAGWQQQELGGVFFEIRLGPHEVREAENLNDILVDLNGDRVRWPTTSSRCS